MQSGSPNIFAIAVSALIVVVVLMLRVRRMTAKRPLNPTTLWIVPTIFFGFAALTMTEFPPRGTEWLWIGIALLLGVALGWQRGRLMKIWVEPESGALMSQGSGWAIVFLVALIALRTLLRTGLAMEAVSMGLINNVFIAFAVGLFGTQRAEMAMRAARLKKSYAEGETGVI